jgi:hypothetical protein
VLLGLRDGGAGDVWVPGSRRYADPGSERRRARVRVVAGVVHPAGVGPLNRCRLSGREELDETVGDGGGIPARQVVARTRYRHRVDFWNPLLQ